MIAYRHRFVEMKLQSNFWAIASPEVLMFSIEQAVVYNQLCTVSIKPSRDVASLRICSCTAPDETGSNWPFLKVHTADVGCCRIFDRMARHVETNFSQHPNPKYVSPLSSLSASDGNGYPLVIFVFKTAHIGRSHSRWPRSLNLSERTRSKLHECISNTM